MKIKAMAGSALAVGLLGLGTLAGSVVGSGGASAQIASGSMQMSTYAQVAQAAATATPASTQGSTTSPTTPTITAKITQQQAEQAALAANAGATVDHISLQSQNGTPVYDVDFTNGGGAIVDGNTGAVLTNEAAGQDQGGRGGKGGKGGVNQAALAAQAKVTKQQAEQAALAAAAGSTVDHSNLQMQNSVVVWDVDFTNGGGVIVDANTGSVITVEAAGTDVGGKGGHGGQGNSQQAPSATATPQP